MADGGYGNGLIKGFPTSTIRNPPSDIKDLSVFDSSILMGKSDERANL
jgi:hypothetical protein